MMFSTFIGTIGCISALETSAQSCIKYAYEHPTMRYIGLLGPLIYSFICYVLYRLYSYEGMALVNAWWNIVTSISVTLTGIFLFGETLKGYDIAGLALVILGSVFLSLEELGII